MSVRDTTQPHYISTVCCANCGRAWMAARPAGIRTLACPYCGREGEDPIQPRQHSELVYRVLHAHAAVRETPEWFVHDASGKVLTQKALGV